MQNGPRATTVLLLDPNNDDRQYWIERLKICSQTYRVLEAKDALSGLAICKSEQIDCVVTELHLPDLSGFQVLLRLNPIVRSLHTPVIVLTNFILPSIVDAAKKLGAQSYLIKSQTSEDDLDRAIQKAIALVRPMSREGGKSCSEPFVSLPCQAD